MPRILGGYALFAICGAAIGYVLATAWLGFRLGIDVDYLAILTGFPGLMRVDPDLAQQTALILGGGTLGAMFLGGYFITERLSLYGVTHWQTHAELRRGQFFQEPGRGFLLARTSRPSARLGRFICSRKHPHCMIVAPTGRGKGVGFVIPNLLTYKGSTVTLDVKGENFEKTSRRRASLGDRVFRFAPTDFTGPSHRYNPLLRIYGLKDPDQQMFELNKLASLFLQTENPGNESLLRGGIKAFVAAGMLAFERRIPTLGEVYRIVNGGGSDYAESFAAHALETRNPQVQLQWEALSKVTERTLSGYISLLNTSGLDPWENHHTDRLTSETDFSFAEIRKVPHSIYLTIPPQDIKPMAGLIRLFFSDLIASLEHHEPGADEPWPVMIVLDEFHKLGKMPIVTESITTLRSYGGQLAIITQTIPKLDEIYGRNERLSLEGGAGIKAYMTPSEEMTVESVSEACGMTTKRVVSKSRQSGHLQRVTVSERSEEVPLLPPDEARRLDREDIILVVDGDHPIRAKAINYRFDRMLKGLFESQDGQDLPALSREEIQIRELRDRVDAGERQVKASAAGEAGAAEESAATLEAIVKLTERLSRFEEKVEQRQVEVGRGGGGDAVDEVTSKPPRRRKGQGNSPRIDLGGITAESIEQERGRKKEIVR
ncbi:type IV secretory system conjugative DNA transfer family protein [Tropicimonas isoalkanivorans]|uniref:Type IV secretion system protein VirD4 n=1 Tax=Tropicimonas isoalkanivorans TaxID=441112 RepID=A0A1I1PXS7_9RHOB|nr:type IV secretory system conjugative DNA transfer family protein [Tropicimonas isoalkanivorans]SFD14721.1 type IV secretion system protein VirD4 [Tropicimonas isoalkanivorans]